MTESKYLKIKSQEREKVLKFMESLTDKAQDGEYNILWKDHHTRKEKNYGQIDKKR